MAHSEILRKASDHIYELFKNKLSKDFIYHNYQHTLDVVKSAKVIGKKTDLDENEMEIIQLSAWFHDSGYTDLYDGHEEKSIELAETFLLEYNYPGDKIEKVKKCILATKYPSNPQNKLEEVISDADLAHIGNEDYPEKSELLRIEWEKCKHKTYSDIDWLKIGIEFLANQHYYTKYAKKKYEEAKTSHYLRQQKKYKKLLEEAEEEKKKSEKIAIDKQKIEMKKEAEKKADRGVETMFRNTIRTHVEFSSMADSKANIMISVNALMISIIFTGMVKEMVLYAYLAIPAFMILSVCIACIVLGIYAAKPQITSGSFTREDISNKKTNLLFFGNFYKMPFVDFEWGINEMMIDREYLYSSMIKDLYSLGIVLEKKYRYLRYCYTIFLYGLVASLIAFVIAISLNMSQVNTGSTDIKPNTTISP